jgi:hypothetical protein
VISGRRSRWSAKAKAKFTVRLDGRAEFGRRMPSEAHLDAVWDTPGMRPDPSLVRVEDDPDLTCSCVRSITGRLAIVKAAPVAGNE